MHLRSSRPSGSFRSQRVSAILRVSFPLAWGCLAPKASTCCSHLDCEGPEPHQAPRQGPTPSKGPTSHMNSWALASRGLGQPF